MIKRICIFIISLITLFSLIACEKNNEIIIPNDGSVEVFYMNRGTIENDDIKLNLKRTKCEKLKKFVLSIEIDLKNKTTYAQKYTLKNVVLINEVTGETYDVDYEKNYSIDVGFTQTLTFSSVMPTSIYSENYKLYFEINSYKFLYYIYNAPSDLN